MKLREPFLIGARLAPALKIGDAWLTLTGVNHGERDNAEFVMDFADGTEYADDQLRSGMQGFRGTVEIFESFLAFLSAAAERRSYVQRTGIDDGEGNLFPTHIEEWAADHASDIENVVCDIQDENGNPRTELIEE